MTRDDSLVVSALERRARAARSGGAPVCDYSENVPKWPMPPQLDGHVDCCSYPEVSGVERLREGIAERERRQYGLALGRENILITNGALHGLSFLFRMLARPVLCQAPVFKLIPEQVRASGLPVEFFRIERWYERARAVSARGGSTQWAVYVNIPSNPFGECPTRDQLHALLAHCVRERWVLIVDMVYDAFTFEGTPPINPLSLSDDWEDVVVVNSFSKNYGAPGLRIGWIESGRKRIEALAAWLERDCIAVAHDAQHAAARLLAHGNRELLEAACVGRDFARILAGDRPRLKLIVPPSGTLLLWEGQFGSVGAFADYVLRERNVLISTSENYAGDVCEHIRLPVGHAVGTIHRAVQAIGDCYEDWIHRAGRGSRKKAAAVPGNPG